MAYSQAYDNLAWQIARESFGDSALAQVFYRMMRQESGFDSDVVEGRRASSAGAQGIAQFMPATAQEEGIDPLNPEQALRGATAYLRKLIAYFGGQVAKGVAAYNAGAGRVEKAVAAGGANWMGYLPTETQTYLATTQPEGVTAMPNGTIETGGIPRPQPPHTGATGAGTPTGSPTPTSQGVMGFGAWTEQNDPDFPWRDRIRSDQPGLIGDAWLKTLTSQERAAKWERYNAATQADSGLTDLERRETEAGIAVDWANARSIIAWDEGSTYEQMRQKMLDLLDQGQVKQENMITEFNAWMSAAVEARLRGEKVYGEEKERAVWTTPGEYYPGTEPGGMNQQMYERYGLGEQYKPSPGVPVSQMPSQEQMYGQWHQNMGISQQAPATAGGWSGQGQGAPQGAGQGTGLNAAMEFLKRMNLRQGAPQGAAPAY